MNKDVCIIPVFNRPEYLFVTLNYIKAAKGSKDLFYLFAVDFGYNKKCIQVINEVLPDHEKELMYNNGSKYGNSKQSFNLLEAYKRACQLTKRFVFLVEDDIFCSRSFFTSHYQIHAKHPDIFCSIGSKLHNHDHIPQGKDQTMNKTTCNTAVGSLYQSLGVCFNKDVLNKYILPHANANFYTSPAAYLKRAFPNHWLNTSFTEQDGLIRRCLDTSKLAVGYPDYPRCYHAGVWSYHRFDVKVHGWTYERKIAYILDVCHSQEKMKQFDKYGDVFVSDLTVSDDIK